MFIEKKQQRCLGKGPWVRGCMVPRTSYFAKYTTLHSDKMVTSNGVLHALPPRSVGCDITVEKQGKKETQRKTCSQVGNTTERFFQRLFFGWRGGVALLT